MSQRSPCAVCRPCVPRTTLLCPPALTAPAPASPQPHQSRAPGVTWPMMLNMRSFCSREVATSCCCTPACIDTCMSGEARHQYQTGVSRQRQRTAFSVLSSTAADVVLHWDNVCSDSDACCLLSRCRRPFPVMDTVTHDRHVLLTSTSHRHFTAVRQGDDDRCQHVVAGQLSTTQPSRPRNASIHVSGAGRHHHRTPTQRPGQPCTSQTSPAARIRMTCYP